MLIYNKNENLLEVPATLFIFSLYPLLSQKVFDKCHKRTKYVEQILN